MEQQQQQHQQQHQQQQQPQQQQQQQQHLHQLQELPVQMQQLQEENIAVVSAASDGIASTSLPAASEGCSSSTTAGEGAGGRDGASSSGPDYSNLQMAPTWPLRMWTHELTQRLLQKVQRRKSLLLDPKLRRRMVYAEVAREFQEEGVSFTPSDIEKKYTSLLSTYRRNIERKKGSTWQYFHILEDIYSEVGPDGERVLLPTSSLNPLQHSPPHEAVGKQGLRHSKRLRTRPARLKGHVDYTDTCVSRSEADATEVLERVREVLGERLDELEAQRQEAVQESCRNWAEVQEALSSMSASVHTLNSSVVMLAHTVTNVMAGLGRASCRK